MHKFDSQEDTSHLWQAVDQGDTEGVRQWLATGADPQVAD